MKHFSVEVIASSGERQHLEMSATSERDIALELVEKGFTPLSISLRNDGWIARLNKPVSWRTGLGGGELAMFSEHMAEMLASGLTVEQALGVISRRTFKDGLGKLAEQTLSLVREGQALSEALSSNGAGAHVAGMVRAAEQSGQMAQTFSDVARYLRREAAIRSKLANALVYPAVVLVTVIAVLGFVLGFVIPQFESIFAGDEALLPRTTRFVLFLSSVLTTYWAWLGGFLVMTIVLILLMRQSAIGRAIWARFLSRLPGALPVLNLERARILSVLGTLIENGVEVSAAVALSASTAGPGELSRRLQLAARRLREGGTVSAVLRTDVDMPDATLSIVEVGEHTGELGRMLQRAAYLLEMESVQRLDRLTALVTPVAIAILGLVVGVVVAGVMMGIMSINQLAAR